MVSYSVDCLKQMKSDLESLSTRLAKILPDPFSRAKVIIRAGIGLLVPTGSINLPITRPT